MKLFYRLILSFIALLIVTKPLLAHETIVISSESSRIPIGKHLYFYIDSTQKLTYNDISSPLYETKFLKSTQEIPNFGHKKITVWCKFYVKNKTNKNAFLVIDNYRIKALSLFYKDCDNQVLEVKNGKSYPFSKRKYKTTEYIFDLPIETTDSTIYFLKIESNLFHLPINIITDEKLIPTSNEKHFLLGVYFGFILLIIVYNLVMYIAMGDRSSLYYLVYVTLTGLMFAEQEGLLSVFWEKKLHFMWDRTSTFIAIASISIFPFTKNFLEIRTKAPIHNKFINYFIIPGFLLAILLDSLNFKVEASSCNQLVGLVALIFLSSTAIYTYRRGLKAARYYLLACGCYFVGVLIYILRTNAYLPHNWFTNASMEIGSAFEMIFFSFSLSDKITNLRKDMEGAEKSRKFKEQFLANMSHEIRTPMNAIVGMTNLTLETTLTPKQTQYLSGIKKSSENLLVIINDILDISKIEAGKMVLDKIPFRLNSLIDQLYNTLKFKAEEKGLELKVELKPNLPEVIIGDQPRLNQVLINLIGNAIKFTSKGSVTLIVEPELNGFIRFRVKDTGIGIAQDKIEDLFEDFNQLDSSVSRRFGGTGLGLSISQKLVLLHGGKSIDVVSELDKGSEFSFSIPFQIGNTESLPKVVSQKIDTQLLQGIRILAAEDNEHNQVVLRDTLETIVTDMTLDIVENGKLAIEKLWAGDYDIVLMDVNMPEMDGYEATHRIRNYSDESKKDIPIIALTASVQEKDVEKFYAAGMSGFIPKPFRKEQLITALLKFYKNIEPDNSESDIKPNDEEKHVDSENKLCDLGFLKEFCGNDHRKMLKYINMFLKNAPESISKVEVSLNTKNYLAISKAAHTLKPQLVYMGINKAIEVAQEIEDWALEGKNIDLLPGKVVLLKELTEKAYIELKSVQFD